MRLDYELKPQSREMCSACEVSYSNLHERQKSPGSVRIETSIQTALCFNKLTLKHTPHSVLQIAV